MYVPVIAAGINYFEFQKASPHMSSAGGSDNVFDAPWSM